MNCEDNVKGNVNIDSSDLCLFEIQLTDCKIMTIYTIGTHQWIFQTDQSKVPQSQSPPLSLMSW